MPETKGFTAADIYEIADTMAIVKRGLKALVLGLGLGMAMGATVGLADIAVNRYLHYGMLQLALLIFRSALNTYAVVFAAEIALIYLVCVFGTRVLRWPKDRAAEFGIIIALLSVAAVLADWVLRYSTDYTVPYAASRFASRTKELLTGQMGAGYWGHLIRTRQKEALILAGGTAVGVLLYLVLRRLIWKLLLGIDRWPRMVPTIAVISVGLLLAINIGSRMHARANAVSGPNVMVIVVDCLRPDHLRGYGYERPTSPNIDRLARQGLLFRNTYAAAPWTKPSVATLFTSANPNIHKAINRLDALPLGVLTIAEIMRNYGYATMLLNGGNSFIGKKFNFDQGFDLVFNEPIDAHRLTDELLRRLRTEQKHPIFAYVHYMDVHLPYNVNKYTYEFCDSSGCRFDPDSLRFSTIRDLTADHGLTDDDKYDITALYDGQIRFVDENIGRIAAFLEDEPQGYETLIILTSDHGEEFWEHHNFEHGHTLYNEVIHVPLILKGPGLPPGRVEDMVRLVDLLPTVLDILHIETSPPGLMGESLLSKTGQTASARVERPVFAMGTIYGPEKYCLIKGSKKLIVNTDDMHDKGELKGYHSDDDLEVFDLGVDPDETTNLSRYERETVTELMRQLDPMRRAESGYKTKKVMMDDRLRERLKALGYL